MVVDEDFTEMSEALNNGSQNASFALDYKIESINRASQSVENDLESVVPTVSAPTTSAPARQRRKTVESPTQVSYTNTLEIIKILNHNLLKASAGNTVKYREMDFANFLAK